MHHRFRAPLLALAALAVATPLAAQAEPSAPAAPGASATPAAPNLPPDFLRRRSAGHGWFATREQFMRRHPAGTLNIFTGAPGVRLVPDGSGGQRVQMTHRMPSSNDRDLPATFSTQRSESEVTGHGQVAEDDKMTQGGSARTQVGDQAAGDSGSDQCRVQYYRNGQRYEPDRESLVSREVPIETVQAVEVYRSRVETPAEFRGAGADCGVVVIWTDTPAPGS